jgi:hypothetical protein
MIITIPTDARTQQARWISGYVASWELNMSGIPGGAGASNYGGMPYKSLDLEALTHILMFPSGLTAQGFMSTRKEWDSSLTWSATLLQQRRKPFNEYVHSKGKCIILTFFAGGTSWTTLISSAEYRANAIQTIKDSVIGSAYKYDGIDWDLEPHEATDTANTRTFFKELYDTLQNYHAWYDVSKKPLMTAAIYRFDPFWASVAPYFNQINIMSYDLFGTWCEKTWHNCPIFLAGATGNISSVQSLAHRRINAGIPGEKIGAGVAVGGGYRWVGGKLLGDTSQGIFAPEQTWNPAFPPTKPIYNEETYYTLRKKYIDTATITLHYDALRKVPWIGVDNPGSENDSYIMFEDTNTMREAVYLVDTMNIGGLMLWHVTGGYLPNSASYYPEASYPGILRDPLLQAVKTAARGTILPQVPIGSLTVSPQTLPVGGGIIKLIWTSQNATSASIDQGIGTVALNDSLTTSITSTKTFTLTLSDGSASIYPFVTVTVQTPSSDVTAPPAELPGDIFQLSQNFPNPFNPTTKIEFQLPITGMQYNVSLKVYDVLGREAASLLSEQMAGGMHSVTWDAATVSAGVYFCRLEARSISGKYAFTESMKLMLLK